MIKDSVSLLSSNREEFKEEEILAPVKIDDNQPRDEELQPIPAQIEMDSELTLAVATEVQSFDSQTSALIHHEESKKENTDS